MNKTKKQHYVPQFYLKRFAKDEQLYVFDKVQGRFFLANVRDIASVRFFYDVPALDELSGTSQTLEKYFHPFEEAGAAVIEQLVKSTAAVGSQIVTIDQRTDLSLFLALQYLRTKETRELMVQANVALYREMFIRHLEEESPELAKYKDGILLSMPKDKETGLHASIILDEDLRDLVAAVFFRHYWVLLRNETGVRLYTSDHPVVNHGTLPIGSYGNNGISSIGAEVVFPLSSDILLLLMDRHAFPNAAELEGTVQKMRGSDNVVYYNSHQVRYSYRYVFCEDADFSLAESMLIETPELGSPNFPRIQVG